MFHFFQVQFDNVKVKKVITEVFYKDCYDTALTERIIWLSETSLEFSPGEDQINL
jgi:hypothetical protein